MTSCGDGWEWTGREMVRTGGIHPCVIEPELGKTYARPKRR